MTYHTRQDMRGMAVDELFDGCGMSLAAEQVLRESPEYPKGSVRLAIQTDNFVEELMSRVQFV